MGASAESSMLEPETNAPAAMMTLSLYPGMSQGSGVKNESTGDAAWTASQKAQILSALPSVIAWIMSYLGSVALGVALNPSLS